MKYYVPGNQEEYDYISKIFTIVGYANPYDYIAVDTERMEYCLDYGDVELSEYLLIELETLKRIIRDNTIDKVLKGE